MLHKHTLRTVRDDAGLTQRRLSQAAGVSTSTISHIECHRGPDVPRSERRKTKTRLSTALKLSLALSQLPPGDYELSDFIVSQTLFTEGEIYEAVRKQFVRPRHSRRHLRSVA